MTTRANQTRPHTSAPSRRRTWRISIATLLATALIAASISTIGEAAMCEQQPGGDSLNCIDDIWLDVESTTKQLFHPRLSPNSHVRPVGIKTEVHAEVRFGDGTPAEGAVIITCEGGQGVTDANGVARFSVDVDPSVKSMHVTAVASTSGVNYIGSAHVPLEANDTLVNAGTFALRADASCQPQWLPTFGGIPGMFGQVRSSTIYDDGSENGARLIAGGNFEVAGGVAARNVAQWDGGTWSGLGEGINGEVWALAAFDDGSGSGPALYAGGSFSMAGGAPASHIAKWDGEAWLALGSGVSGTVLALAVFDDGTSQGPELYVGGGFTSAGGGPANRLAKWNGESWSAVGEGVNGYVNALFAGQVGEDQSALYIGGSFTFAGGIEVNRVARWDGNDFSALDNGVDSTVNDLIIHDDGTGPSVYVSGMFTTSGGVVTNHIARWDGEAWSSLAGGVAHQRYTPIVLALSSFDDGSGAGPLLYAGGHFETAGGIEVNHIARWDGTAWSPLDGGVTFGAGIFTLAANSEATVGTHPMLFAGGAIGIVGGTVHGHGVVAWDGNEWTSLGAGMNSTVHDLTVFDDGSGGGPALYAGGSFNTAGGLPASAIARWDGTSWSSLGSGMQATSSNPSVRALAVFDDDSGDGPALYAAGRFDFAGDLPANNIAKWDGDTWSPLGSGVDGFVFALIASDSEEERGPALYAAGTFTSAGNVAAMHIAKWDGSSWSALGAGLNEWTHALAFFDDGVGNGPMLIAGGDFTIAGNTDANHIARWNADAHTWSALDDGLNSNVRALTVFDDRSGSGTHLYAGGWFTFAGDIPASRIARWDGSAWSPVGDGVSVDHFGDFAAIRSFSVFDDGSGDGPALFVGGHFDNAGSVAADSIAKWDGSGWSAVGEAAWGSIEGFTASILALQPCQSCTGEGPALFAGGGFMTSTTADSFLARWQGCPPTIPGDLNGDGVVNVADLLVLLGQWGLCADCDTCPADLNGDCSVSIADLLILLANWG